MILIVCQEKLRTYLTGILFGFIFIIDLFKRIVIVKILVIITACIFVVLIAVLLIILVTRGNQEIKADTSPDAPQELEAKTISATQIGIVWKDTSNNELSFEIVRDGQSIQGIPNNSSSFTDYNLKPATVYQYEVFAVNSVGKTSSGVIAIKTKNPPIVVRLDKIGVSDVGESFLRRLIDKDGEVFIGIVVDDGKTKITKRLPVQGHYDMSENSVIDIGLLLYSSQEIGEYLNLNVIGFESDGGIGEEILIEALNTGVKLYIGPLSSIMIKLAGIDFTETLKKVMGFDDDYLGEYIEEWNQTDYWGVGSYVDIPCKTGNNTIGLRLWFTISSSVTP